MKNKIRFFPIYCCKSVIQLDEDIFTADGRLNFYCERHGGIPVVSYLSWRSGLTEEAFNLAKKKKEEANEFKLKAR